MFNFIPRNYFNIQIANNKELQTFKKHRPQKSDEINWRRWLDFHAGKIRWPVFRELRRPVLRRDCKANVCKKETWSLTSIDKDSIIHRGIKQVTVANE